MSFLSDASSPAPPSLPPLLGRAIRPLPLLPLQLALGRFLQRVCSRNPQIFARLGPHAGKRFGIEPTDLPFAFVVEAVPPRPRLSVRRELPAELDARISASLASLLALLEGRVDGDALMFSRDLTIEGDVEAVLALRNAIDDTQLDLAGEIGSLFGPFGRSIERILDAARGAILGAARSQDGIR